jgi:thiazole synthase
MEFCCDGVMVDTAIAQSRNPPRMAATMRVAVVAGRLAPLAGGISKRRFEEPGARNSASSVPDT